MRIRFYSQTLRPPLKESKLTQRQASGRYSIPERSIFKGHPDGEDFKRAMQYTILCHFCGFVVLQLRPDSCLTRKDRMMQMA